MVCLQLDKSKPIFYLISICAQTGTVKFNYPQPTQKLTEKKLILVYTDSYACFIIERNLSIKLSHFTAKKIQQSEHYRHWIFKWIFDFSISQKHVSSACPPQNALKRRNFLSKNHSCDESIDASRTLV